MVTKTARRPHNNMDTFGQCSAFIAHIHTANTACRLRACLSVEPIKLTLDLQCEFPRRRNRKCQRCISAKKSSIILKQCGRHSEAKRDRFARTRLCRHQHILAKQFRFKHCVLHRRQGFIALFRQSVSKRWVGMG